MCNLKTGEFNIFFKAVAKFADEIIIKRYGKRSNFHVRRCQSGLTRHAHTSVGITWQPLRRGGVFAAARSTGRWAKFTSAAETFPAGQCAETLDFSPTTSGFQLALGSCGVQRSRPSFSDLKSDKHRLSWARLFRDPLNNSVRELASCSEFSGHAPTSVIVT